MIPPPHVLKRPPNLYAQEDCPSRTDKELGSLMPPSSSSGIGKHPTLSQPPQKGALVRGSD